MGKYCSNDVIVQSYVYLLGKFDSDNTLRMYLYGCAPEFQFGVYSAVEYELVAVCVERRYRWMMRHLLAHYSKMIITACKFEFF